MSLESPLKAAGVTVYKIGGSHTAAELDAKRAIDQASRLAAEIEIAKPEEMQKYGPPVSIQAWIYEKLASKRD